jgi:hypothetical protein
MSTGVPGSNVEVWWPHLSIAAKHRLLADLDAPIDAATGQEIESLTGLAPPYRLTPGEADFIRTQIEAVD